MADWVVIYDGPGGEGWQSARVGTALLLGRDPDACDVVLDDPSVSRRHVRLTHQGAEVTLMDLQSKTGTWAKDKWGKEERVTFRTLQAGEKFRVANFQIRWEREPPYSDDDDDARGWDYPECVVG